MREILPQTMFLYENDTIQFSYNVTLYLTVLCRAAPALNQNLRSRAGGALTPIFRLRAALQVHIWHSERPPRFQAIFCVESGPKFSVSFIFIQKHGLGQYFPHCQSFSYSQLDIDIYKWKNKSSINPMCVQKRLTIYD